MRPKWTRIWIAGFCAGLVFNIGGTRSAVAPGLPASFERFGVERGCSVVLHEVGVLDARKLGPGLRWGSVEAVLAGTVGGLLHRPSSEGGTSNIGAGHHG